MVMRRHGVIGGPRQKPIRPRTKVNYPQENYLKNFPNEEDPQAIVVSRTSEEDKSLRRLPLDSEPLEKQTTDEDEQEPEVITADDNFCPYCFFESKSSAGLKIHIKRMHKDLLESSGESE